MNTLSFVLIQLIILTVTILLTAYANKKCLSSKITQLVINMKHFNLNTYTFTYKGKKFEVKGECINNGSFHTKRFYINDEMVLTINELDHTFMRSREVDYEHNRDMTQIDKILSNAVKQLNKRYHEEQVRKCKAQRYY